MNQSSNEYVQRRRFVHNGIEFYIFFQKLPNAHPELLAYMDGISVGWQQCCASILDGDIHSSVCISETNKKVIQLTGDFADRGEALVAENRLEMSASFEHALANRSLVSLNYNEVVQFSKKRPDMYFPTSNGRYPFRSAEGAMLKVIKINNYPYLADHTPEEPWMYKQAVLPFIRENMESETGRRPITEQDRAALYQTKLDCRKIENQQMLRNPFEHKLVGQYTVYANVNISAKTCLGVYGGTVLARRVFAENTAHWKELNDQLVVEGDNILSKVNTIFRYDHSGQPVGEDREACNALLVSYGAELGEWKDGKWVSTARISLPVAFSRKNIRAGDELRFAYGLSNDAVVRRFATSSTS